MKKTIILVLAVSLIIAGVAMATVVSSKHDMRENQAAFDYGVRSVGSTTSQVCVFCHHPHSGSTIGTVLLWNINDVDKTYATYSSPTTNASGMGGDLTVADDNARYSLLCMGCHDGGASNAFVRATVDGDLGAVPSFGTISANLGSTLADDHPVDFTYPTATAAGLEDINVAVGGQVVGTVSGSSVTYPLYGGTMQCATCHNVHAGETSDVQFMRGQNIIADSAICRDCHTAK